MVEVWEILESDPYKMRVRAYRDGAEIWTGAAHPRMIEDTVRRDGTLILIPLGGNPNQRIVSG